MKVDVNAPEVVKLPPKVIVDAPLLTPVPPRVPDNNPVHPSVNDVASSSAVAGVPPKVIVTLVSSTLVSAEGVTTPPPGTAQVPSPRQKDVPVAPVPEFKLVTGRFPVTPVVKGSPVQVVSAPETGVPKVGVVMIGETEPRNAPVPDCPVKLFPT
ncbi:MAG: hypothetical protein ACRC1W_12260 [Shewanella sp.]